MTLTYGAARNLIDQLVQTDQPDCFITRAEHVAKLEHALKLERVVPDCHCMYCDTMRWGASFTQPSDDLFSMLPPSVRKMFLCSICGNKRCPHSDHHANDCTNSNDPGQLGSRYYK